MMHRTVFAFVAALFCACSVYAQAGWSAERKERAKKAGEERMAYAASKDYSPFATESKAAMKNAVALLKKKNYTGALKVVDSALKKHPCDIDLWEGKEVILEAKGEPQKAYEARLRYQSLLDSILLRGDGKSLDTAYKVISVSEEYSLMRALGLSSYGQQLVGNNGSMFDKIAVKDSRTGKKSTLYFNVDVSFRAYDKIFSNKKK